MKDLILGIYYSFCRFFRDLPLNTKRFFKFTWQKITKGFSDDETWALDYRIAKFISPRLKRFKELDNGHPFDVTSEQWDTILDKTILAFEHLSGKDSIKVEDYKIMSEQIDEGLDLFRKYYRDLWW
jgi:hypothetical protein